VCNKNTSALYNPDDNSCHNVHIRSTITKVLLVQVGRIFYLFMCASLSRKQLKNCRDQAKSFCLQLQWNMPMVYRNFSELPLRSRCSLYAVLLAACINSSNIIISRWRDVVTRISMKHGSIDSTLRPSVRPSVSSFVSQRDGTRALCNNNSVYSFVHTCSSIT